MSLYELVVASVLVGSAIGYITIRICNHSREGKIQLQVYDYFRVGDPFDIAKPEEFTDGEPIEEAQFWSEVLLYYCC